MAMVSHSKATCLFTHKIVTNTNGLLSYTVFFFADYGKVTYFIVDFSFKSWLDTWIWKQGTMINT